jgi:hypothetical protein
MKLKIILERDSGSRSLLESPQIKSRYSTTTSTENNFLTPKMSTSTKDIAELLHGKKLSYKRETGRTQLREFMSNFKRYGADAGGAKNFQIRQKLVYRIPIPDIVKPKDDAKESEIIEYRNKVKELDEKIEESNGRLKCELLKLLDGEEWESLLITCDTIEECFQAIERHLLKQSAASSLAIQTKFLSMVQQKNETYAQYKLRYEFEVSSIFYNQTELGPASAATVFFTGLLNGASKERWKNWIAVEIDSIAEKAATFKPFDRSKSDSLSEFLQEFRKLQQKAEAFDTVLEEIEPTKVKDDKKSPSGNRFNNKARKMVAAEESDGKSIYCYLCHGKGHKKPDCKRPENACDIKGCRGECGGPRTRRKQEASKKLKSKKKTDKKKASKSKKEDSDSGDEDLEKLEEAMKESQRAFSIAKAAQAKGSSSKGKSSKKSMKKIDSSDDSDDDAWLYGAKQKVHSETKSSLVNNAYTDVAGFSAFPYDFMPRPVEVNHHSNSNITHLEAKSVGFEYNSSLNIASGENDQIFANFWAESTPARDSLTNIWKQTSEEPMIELHQINCSHQYYPEIFVNNAYTDVAGFSAFPYDFMPRPVEVLHHPKHDITFIDDTKFFQIKKAGERDVTKSTIGKIPENPAIDSGNSCTTFNHTDWFIQLSKLPEKERFVELASGATSPIDGAGVSVFPLHQTDALSPYIIIIDTKSFLMLNYKEPLIAQNVFHNDDSRRLNNTNLYVPKKVDGKPSVTIITYKDKDFVTLPGDKHDKLFYACVSMPSTEEKRLAKIRYKEYEAKFVSNLFHKGKFSKPTLAERVISVEMLHQMTTLGPKRLEKLAGKLNETGFAKIKETEKIQKLECIDCSVATIKSKPYVRIAKMEVGDVDDQYLFGVHDLAGKMHVLGYGKKRYGSIINFFTDGKEVVWGDVRVIHKKDDSRQHIMDAIANVQHLSKKKVQFFQPDGLKETGQSAILQEYFSMNQIKKGLPAAYESQTHGAAEAAVQSNNMMTLKLFEHSKRPIQFHGLFREFAGVLRNYVFLDKNGLSNFERLTGNPYPDVNWLLRGPIGCLAVILIPKEQRRQLEPRGKRVIFAGVNLASSEWIFFSPIDQRLMTSRNARFFPDQFGEVNSISATELKDFMQSFKQSEDLAKTLETDIQLTDIPKHAVETQIDVQQEVEDLQVEAMEVLRPAVDVETYDPTPGRRIQPPRRVKKVKLNAEQIPLIKFLLQKKRHAFEDDDLDLDIKRPTERSSTVESRTVESQSDTESSKYESAPGSVYSDESGLESPIENSLNPYRIGLALPSSSSLELTNEINNFYNESSQQIDNPIDINLQRSERKTRSINPKYKKANTTSYGELEKKVKILKSNYSKFDFDYKNNNIAYSAAKNINRFLDYKLKGIPRSEKEANDERKYPGWKIAMQNEVKDISDAGCARLVPKKPDMKVIGFTWVNSFRDKEPKQKARWCPLGNQRTTKGETYAPVISKTGMKISLTLAATYGWEIEGADAKGAFQNTHKIDGDKIYVKVPEYWPNPDALDLSKHVLEIMKWIYGFGESLHEWCKIFFAVFRESLKMSRTSKDWAMFYMKEERNINKKTRDVLIGTAGVHVDDVLFCGEKDFVTKAKGKLSEKFRMNDIPWKDGVMRVLGWDVSRDRDLKQVYISVEHYIDKIAENHVSIPTRIYHTPMDSNFSFNYDTTIQILPKDQQDEFHSLHAEINYIVEACPDVKTASSILGSYVNRAQIYHLKALYRVLFYLIATKDFVLVLGPDKDGKLELSSGADAAYASEEHKKSRIGVTVKYGASLIECISKRHIQTTPLSACESEIVALAEAGKRTLANQELLSEIGAPVTKPTIINEDNQGAIAIAEHNKIQDKSRHIQIRYLAWREWIEQKLIKLKYKESRDHETDMFTKPNPRDLFEKHRFSIGVMRIAEAKKRGVCELVTNADVSIRSFKNIL